MEFKEYLAIIRRRWLLFFPIFLLIVGAHLVWVSYRQKDRYTATSKVILGEGESSFRGNNNLPINPVERLSLITKEATLTHRPVMEHTARLALGEAEFQSSEFSAEHFASRIESAREMAREKFGEGSEGHLRLVNYLRGHTMVETNRDRQIADLTVEADTEDLALLFSWALAEGAFQFHNEKAREHLADYLVEIQSKIAEAEAEVDSAAASLDEIKEATAIADLNSQEKLIQEQLYAYRGKEATLEAEARTNDKKIQSRLQKQSWDQRVDINEAKLLTSRRLEQIRDQLFQIKLGFETRVTELSPEHPEMKKLRGEMIGLENALADEQNNLIKERFQAFSDETNRLINANAGLTLQREVYKEQQARLKNELDQLHELRKKFAPREAAYSDAKERLAALHSMEKEVRWQADSRVGSVIVYDPAASAVPVMLPGGGVGPLTLTILMAFIFALGVVYIVEYVDTRVKNEHDIRRHLNLPLLGIIPKEIEQDRLLIDAPLQCEISEKFNTAATLLQSTANDLGIRALMVCSAIAREGKTTVSINLAVALARKGLRVVLIDGDLRISQIHNLLRVPNHVGLSTALDSRVNAQQMIEGVLTEDDYEGRAPKVTNLVQSTVVPNLDVLPSGPPVSDPVILLDPARLQKLVADLKQSYDFVIFDTPPINKVGDALTISSAIDGSVFVVGAGQAEQHEVTWAKHLLTNVQSNILGVFLNKFSKQKGGEYYYYYYYNDKKRKRIKSRA